MDKYQEFLRIARHLNTELKIIPVLYGSLGLSTLLKKDLHSKDIDILVPQKYITSDWDKMKKTLAKIGYKTADEKEHEFTCRNNRIGIGFEEDLVQFARIDYKELKIKSDQGTTFKTLDLKQYLKAYEAATKDSYRSQKDNKKDLEKIKLISCLLKNISHIK